MFTEEQIKAILNRKQRIVSFKSKIIIKNDFNLSKEIDKITYCVLHKFLDEHAILEDIETGLIKKRKLESLRFLSDSEIKNLYTPQQKLPI